MTPFTNFASESVPLQVGALALDATHIYVTVRERDQGSVRRVSKLGAQVELVATTDYPTEALTVDAEQVYFNMALSGPHAVDKSGGEPRLLGVQAPLISGVAVDDDHVYATVWATQTDGVIIRSSKLTGVTDVLASDGNLPEGVVVDSTSLYWINSSGEVFSLAKQGGSSMRLALGRPGSSCLAQDEQFIYFCSGGYRSDGEVNRVSKAGGPAELLAEAGGFPRGLAVWGGRVYVGTWEGVLSFKTDGTDAGIVAGSDGAVHDIQGDADGIFWVSDNNGLYRFVP